MRRDLKLGGSILIALIAGVALGAALWPHGFTEAAFGVDISPSPGQAAEPGPWVATALVRIAGIWVATFAAMILGTWSPRPAGRRIFGILGTFAVAIAVAQWISILPFAVGLTVTGLCLSLVTGGYIALTHLERREETGA